MAIASKSFSQTLNEPCECIPLSKLRVAAYKIDKGAKDSVKLIMQQQIIDTLSGVVVNQQRRLDNKDSTISDLRKIDTVCMAIVRNYDRDIGLAERQYREERKISEDLRRQLKGQRRKTIFVGLAGLAAAVAVKLLL